MFENTKNKLKCVKIYFLRLALIWLVNKLDNSIISDEAEMSRETRSSVCKIELLFVTRDVRVNDEVPQLHYTTTKGVLNDSSCQPKRNIEILRLSAKSPKTHAF